MNQEIVFASDRHFGHTALVEFGEFPFASCKGTHLELNKKWNEKVRLKEIYIV
ncbi:hypothetical protein [Flavobacterium chilense]|uniref:Phosphoesterase n=1 Tax=Flavobacterium chilense TaxID=946677 RepID=A0A1M7HVW5_9FLAO|nr:hypothetical protein [Flavobacterium chilense]SHM32605.1 hypothetical protein SAMN05444484_105154 [Flavobacterium chilense]